MLTMLSQTTSYQSRVFDSSHTGIKNKQPSLPHCFLCTFEALLCIVAGLEFHV